MKYCKDCKYLNYDFGFMMMLQKCCDFNLPYFGEHDCHFYRRKWYKFWVKEVIE